jgi:hypothetical protein
MKSGVWFQSKNDKAMEETKQSGILKGDQRLRSLHITDKRSKTN